MLLEETLSDIRMLYYHRNKDISESQYKQTIFKKFFESLGYLVDLKKGIDEIQFEVPDEHGGKIDIMVGKNILVEVKSSNKSLEDKEIIEQAFRYNSNKGAKYIVLTNFKKMDIYEIGKNNKLCSLEFLDYNETTTRELYRILHPYSLKDSVKFNDFFRNYFIPFKEYFLYLKEFINKPIEIRHSTGVEAFVNIYDENEIENLRLFFEKMFILTSFIMSNIEECYSRNKLIMFNNKLIETWNSLNKNSIFYKEDIGKYFIKEKTLLSLATLTMEIIEAEKYINKLIDINIFANNLEMDEYVLE